jgi:hypothetical protein
MEVLHARCAGLDVHKQTVVACVRVTMAGRAQHEVRTFATTAPGCAPRHDWHDGVTGCAQPSHPANGTLRRVASQPVPSQPLQMVRVGAQSYLFEARSG